jgi:signal transduction histidine kinase
VTSLRPSRDFSRFPWLILLLASAFLLTLALAWQAAAAARSHRTAAERVLRDDAELAAVEFLRRARYQVGYFAFYPALRIVADAEHSAGRLPDPAALSAEAPIAPLSFLRTIVSVELATGHVTTSPPADAELGHWLDANLARLVRKVASPGGELVVSHALVGGQARTFVYGRSPLPGQARGLGFEVDLASLRPSFQKALDEAPLLPEPIARLAGTGNPVFLELMDPWDRPLLRTKGAFDPSLGFTQTVGAGDVLAGLTVRASIAKEAASLLVAGGLPPARVPLYVAAAALAATLFAAAILLSRRERDVARLRADFVSSVSHELRTPLAQIRLFAETLRLDRVRTPEERRRSLEIIDTEARRLTQLVENTLVLSRGERGASSVSPRPQDVAGLVRETLDSFAPIAAATSSRIERDLPQSLEGSVDADALRQVLVNLLDNAVRYGPSGQRIRVGLDSENGGVRITVEDEGPGVPPRERDRIFDRFARLDRDRETHRSGTGIGLSVARELVTLHGGVIRAEAGEGGGARFVVELPAGTPSQP